MTDAFTPPHSRPLSFAGEGGGEGQSEVGLNRLRWRCRRGMLELDAALSAFLDRELEYLAPAHRRAFAALLALEDAELLDRVLGHAAPDNADQAWLLARIRAGCDAEGD